MEKITQTIAGNRKNYMVSSALYSFAANFLAGGFITAFYVDALGLDAVDISLIGTTGSIASVVGYLALTLRTPKNLKRAMILTAFLLALTPLSLLAALAAGRFALLVPMLCLTGAVVNLATSVKGTVEYCTAPMLFYRREYGPLVAKTGIIGGIVSIAVSMLGVLVSDMEAGSRYALYFIVGLLAYLFSGVFVTRYRLLSDLEPALEQKDPKTGKGSVGLKRRVWMLLPHVLRGIATVGTGYIVYVAMKNIEISPAGQSLLVTISSVGLLAACSLYMLLEKHLRTGVLILLSYIVCGVTGVWACLTHSEVLFLLLYGLFLVANQMVNYSVPTGVLYSTRNEELAYISSVRMLAMMLPSLLLTTPIAMLIERVEPWLVIAAVSVLGLIGGWIYFVQYQDQYK